MVVRSFLHESFAAEAKFLRSYWDLCHADYPEVCTRDMDPEHGARYQSIFHPPLPRHFADTGAQVETIDKGLGTGNEPMNQKATCRVEACCKASCDYRNRCDVGRSSLIEDSEASPHGGASEWSVPMSRRCPFRHHTSPPTCLFPAALPDHQIPSVATVWRCCVLQSSYLSRHPLEAPRLTTAPEQAHRYRSAVISSVIARRSPTSLGLSSSISSFEASYQLAPNQIYAPLDATRKVLLRDHCRAQVPSWGYRNTTVSLHWGT